MRVNRSGFYAWLKQPKSQRCKYNEKLTAIIKHAWLQSGGVYGYRKVHDDLQEWGYRLSPNRVHRLMSKEGLQSERVYKRRKGFYAGPIGLVADNLLNRDFEPKQANEAWVTDITQVRTYEGWLYLAVVIDLYSRQVVGWSMQNTMHVDIVLQALLSAVWKHKPKQQVLIHSDQGSQYTSGDWQSFLNDHSLICSMSRRGTATTMLLRKAFLAY